MADEASDTSPPPADPQSHTRVQEWFLAVLPYVITVCVAVAISVLIRPLPAREPGAGAAPPAQHSPVATVLATSSPSPSPTMPPPTRVSTAPATAAAGTLADDPADPAEIAGLRQELDRLWSAFYLSRAANQLADAEAALRVNDMEEVEQMLETSAASLDRAYDRGSEQDKGPISEFRNEVSQVHADLRVRPDGIDQQLQRLRQSMLSLIDESG